MKKSILSFLFVFILIFAAKNLYAQEIAITQTSEIQTSSPTSVNYDLTFPGILPNHPLYKLKVLRDKISAAIISNPLKKIDFYLLQTDKGILAAAMLVDKNKIDLASETALKAEHNYTLLTYQLYRISKKPNEEFFNRLKTASLKHQEVLQSILERVPSDKQKTFETVINFSKTNYETVERYKNSE